jgi:hypothetical protein
MTQTVSDPNNHPLLTQTVSDPNHHSHNDKILRGVIFQKKIIFLKSSMAFVKLSKIVNRFFEKKKNHFPKVLYGIC